MLIILVTAGSCSIEDPVVQSDAYSSIEFSSSKMRIITKAGDQSQKFQDGVKFKLFAVESSAAEHDWSSVLLYDRIGTESSGTISYGDKVSYGVAPLNVLDFYGVTYGDESEVEIKKGEGDVPEVSVSMTDGTLPDLMFSDNLKSMRSSDGRLNMEFRHAMSKINIEILKQDESADNDKKLENAVLKKIELYGTGKSATFNVETGTWDNIEVSSGITVYDGNLKLSNNAITIVSDMLVIPIADGEVKMKIFIDGVDGANESVEYTLMISNDKKLHFQQNHEYTLSVAVLKNDVRIVTVTPKTYDWIDVDLGNVAYFGQPVYFGGLMWMDRNLGAKSADCDNDWYNTIGYYYQHGRNIPYILDVDVWKEKYDDGINTKIYYNNQADLNFPNGLIYTYDNNGKRVSSFTMGYGYSDNNSTTPYYKDVAVNPGDPGRYDFIMGFAGNAAWAKADNGTESTINHTYWDTIENQPCPKGWRLPTRKDLHKFMPEEYTSNVGWKKTYAEGNVLRTNYFHSGTTNPIGEKYSWKYFTAMFKVDSDASGDWSYPVSDNLSRVYLIKYEGTSSAYRIMIEQRTAAEQFQQGETPKMYVRISRFNSSKDERFQMDSEYKRWNLHKFDWDNPVEYMDFPLTGYIDADGFFAELGYGCILRAQETDLSVTGRNWTMYLREDFQGVAVGGRSRRALGDQIRCVRDVNAK